MAKIDAGVKFRDARKGDADAVTDLVVRLKRLNEEFDTMLKVRDDVREQAKAYVTNALKDRDSIIIVAEREGRVMGFVKVEILDRIFNEPGTEGRVQEFYIMPEFRKHEIGTELMRHALGKLKQRGIHLVSAEFPSQNRISVEFYAKQGFRPITNIHAKML
jgi:ribosomal protein S18 acetylase RimI-like enzyme